MGDNLDGFGRKNGLETTENAENSDINLEKDVSNVRRIKRRISHILALIAVATSGVCGTACPGEARAGTARGGQTDGSGVFEEEDESGYYAMEDLLGRLARRGEFPGNACEVLGELLDVDWEVLKNSPCEGFDDCVEPTEDIFERMVRMAIEENPDKTLELLLSKQAHVLITEEHILLARNAVNRKLREQAVRQSEEMERHEREIDERERAFDDWKKSRQ